MTKKELEKVKMVIEKENLPELEYVLKDDKITFAQFIKLYFKNKYKK